MMGFVLLTSVGLKAILFYLIVYLFMNLGAFYVVVLVANGSRSEEISDFSGLGSRAPFAAVSLAIFLFALTGIPPFSGFIGKVYLFAEVINRGIYWLALVAALNSVVSLYYYARILKVMFLEDPMHKSELAVAFVPRVMLMILVVPTLLFGVYWEPVIRIAESSVRLLTN
jgi:NADH-quinone oxidoreductase subunit N